MNEITLSRAQRLQVLALVITHTVAAKMLEETDTTRNADRVRLRIEAQAGAILASMPKYGARTLRQLSESTNTVWGVQTEKSIDAVTMLNICLYLVEGIRAALRDAGRKPGMYAPWSRLAGSMFTLSRHLGEQWSDPYNVHQVQAVELGKAIEAAA